MWLSKIFDYIINSRARKIKEGRHSILDPFQDTLQGKCCFECFRYFSQDGIHIYAHRKPTICMECWDRKKACYTDGDLTLNASNIGVLDFS